MLGIHAHYGLKTIVGAYVVSMKEAIMYNKEKVSRLDENGLIKEKHHLLIKALDNAINFIYQGLLKDPAKAKTIKKSELFKENFNKHFFKKIYNDEIFTDCYFFFKPTVFGRQEKIVFYMKIKFRNEERSIFLTNLSPQISPAEFFYKVVEQAPLVEKVFNKEIKV